MICYVFDSSNALWFSLVNTSKFPLHGGCYKRVRESYTGSTGISAEEIYHNGVSLMSTSQITIRLLRYKHRCFRSRAHTFT